MDPLTHPEELRVLVLEDNPGDRRLVDIALRDGREAGFPRCQTLAFGDLGNGLAVLKSNEFDPDAILLDLGLPDVSGFDGLLSLHGANPRVPIIVLTGLSDLSTATEALKLGASDYLEKGEMQSKMLWRAIRYAMERKKNETALVALANTDPLTGLLNRRAFFDQLDGALDHSRRTELGCAVITFDIDAFKDINDMHGHQIGDQLLTAIASEVSACLRKTDMIGRIGGDEFAVVAQNLKTPNGAIEIAEKIRNAVGDIRNIAGIDLHTMISIGIAVSPPDESVSDVLVSHADIAMYKSKRSKGKARIHYFDDRMDAEVKSRHVIKKSIIGDIERGRFYLDYQPIVDATGKIVGAEALARWRGPDGKLIPPSEFIPIAEEAGWITLLSRRLVETACEEVRDIIAAGLTIVPISLNVSAIQCRDDTFAAQLIETIQRFGIEPKLFNVEITESTIIQNVKATQNNLEVLKLAGLGIHIDDFGTGYSSLSVLKDLPLDGLKIDRSFVANLPNDAGSTRIVQAIAELSRALGLRTIAEGVEDLEQVGPLCTVGVDFLQGYYFSRPVAVSTFRELLALPAAAATRLPLAQSA